MGIPQVDTCNKTGLCVPNIHSKKCDSEPPEIPPRMKKKGPELPEKPAHLRLASLTKTSKPINSASAIIPQASSQSQHQQTGHVQQQQQHRNKKTEVNSVPYGKGHPSNDQKLFLDIIRKKSASSNREILVAATKGARDRPAEKRQREPAKLLTPISNSLDPEDREVDDDSLPVLLGLSSPKPRRKNNTPLPSTAVSKLESYKPLGIASNNHKFNKGRAPVILIPRSQLDTRSLHQIWNSYPVSYSVWVQNSGSGDPHITSRFLRRSLSPGANGLLLRQGQEKTIKGGIVKSREYPLETKIFVSGKKSSSSAPTSGTSAKPRSSSVTRSGSLTSHGSTSSDSGNETFPKSVLKKHKRDSCSSASANSKKSNEQKKNVTFNAFATVQLMEE